MKSIATPAGSNDILDPVSGAPGLAAIVHSKSYVDEFPKRTKKQPQGEAHVRLGLNSTIKEFVFATIFD